MKMTRQLRAAMRRAGLQPDQIAKTISELNPQAKIRPLSHRMAKSVARIRHEHGYAVVTDKRVFTPQGWENRRKGAHKMNATKKAKALLRQQVNTTKASAAKLSTHGSQFTTA